MASVSPPSLSPTLNSCSGERKLGAPPQMSMPVGRSARALLDRLLRTPLPHLTVQLTEVCRSRAGSPWERPPPGSVIGMPAVLSHSQTISKRTEPNHSLGKQPLKRDSLIATSSRSHSFWKDPSHAITITFIHGDVYPKEVLGGHPHV